MLQRELTEEQNICRGADRKFPAGEIVPHMEVWREAGIVDREAFRKAGERALAIAMTEPDAGSELAVADLGGRLHCGHGWMDEYPISRQYTDANIASIHACRAEVMKIIISRDCLDHDYCPVNTRNF